jgi:4'-phosphopantetheinyl transferase
MSVAPSLPSSFQLASDEVHSWCAGLDVPPETSAGLYATLSPDERARSGRFRFERDRQRFIVAHGVLRDLLGRYLQTQPGRISYVYNAFGKPDLSPEFGSELRFNLSHSDDLALIAIGARADLGIDVEHIRPQPDYADIARHLFPAAEADQLNRLPRHLHAEAFLSCWTKKEAYLKACGRGLATLPDSFSVPVPVTRWSFYTLQPTPGYIGALAIEGSGWRLRQWQWQPSPWVGPGSAINPGAPRCDEALRTSA